MTTVLVGLGNPVRGDDAVGLHVAEAVGRLLAERPLDGVRVATSTRGGLELLDLLEGADRAVVVDCLEAPNALPGRIRTVTLDALAGSARLVGSHDIGLAAAVELGRLLGLSMPDRLDVVGVEANLDDEITEGLSPEVASAVPGAAAWICRLLQERSLPVARSETTGRTTKTAKVTKTTKGSTRVA
jgi:hydrogenase maturation protease